MTDPRSPAADAELLSAYLAGDLDDETVELFEHRLAAEPALATQLDALAAALVALHGADDAGPPEGFADRLQERLAAEAAGEAAVDQGAGGATDVTSLDVARAQRRARTRWWAAVGTVAAVVAAGALMASGALQGLGGGGEDAAAPTAESAGEAADTRGDESATEQAARAEDGADTSAGSAAAVPPAPVISDERVVLRDDDDVRRRYRRSDPVQRLLGTPIDQAADLSAMFTDLVREAPPFSDGTAPAACLGTIATDAAAPLIPVQVETVRYAGEPALAYVVVTAAPDAEELDRAEIWVLSRDSCATLVFVQQ